MANPQRGKTRPEVVRFAQPDPIPFAAHPCHMEVIADITIHDLGSSKVFYTYIGPFINPQLFKYACMCLAYTHIINSTVLKK